MKLFCANGITSPAGDAVFSLVFVLGTVAAVIGLVWLIMRFMNRDEKGRSFAALAGMIIGIGVVVRLIAAFTVAGYREDMDVLYAMMDGGFKHYYSGGGSLFPLTALVYRLMGTISGGLNAADSIWMQFFAKLPLIAADACTALILYLTAKRYLNGYVGVIVAGFYSVCPLFLLGSAVWGSVYPIVIVGCVSTMYFLVRRNYPGLTLTFALTLTTGKEAVYLVPVMAVFVVYAFVKACFAVKKAENGIMADPQASLVVKLPVYVVLSVLAAYLVSLPAILSDYGGNFFTWIYRFFLRPLVDLTYFGYNSLGIFNLFGKNGDLLGSGFPAVVFAVVFGALVLGIVLLVYLSKKNRANLVLTAGYVLMTLATYFVDFGAMSLLLPLALMLFAFVVIRDKRILRVFGLTALAVTINASVILSAAGYLGNAEAALFASSNAAYTGTTLMDGGFNMAMNIICSVIAVLAHLYFTLVILDISISDKRCLLAGDRAASLRSALKTFVK